MARTGRPRGFDKDAALEKAMLLFWASGYDAASLAQLKAAMGGISTASFYAAFGSKEALFRDVTRRYIETHGQVTAPLNDPALPPREAVELALRQSARMQTDPAHPPGCLVALSAGACSPESRHVQAVLAEKRARNRAGLHACMARAVSSGTLPAGSDAAGLATMFDTFLTGLSTQARDGVPLSALDAAISRLMSVWDSLAATARPLARPGQGAGSGPHRLEADPHGGG